VYNLNADEASMNDTQKEKRVTAGANAAVSPAQWMMIVFKERPHGLYTVRSDKITSDIPTANKIFIGRQSLKLYLC
jgi:hypothetical protein